MRTLVFGAARKRSSNLEEVRSALIDFPFCIAASSGNKDRTDGLSCYDSHLDAFLSEDGAFAHVRAASAVW